MHPIIKILTLILVLLLVGMVNHAMLFLIMVFFLMLILALKIQTFLHAVSRMRWLFLSILVIYAFATPGELIPYFPVHFAPSYEGLGLGIMQVIKLLIALAALSVLLTSSPRQEMMLGLYMLLTPFKLAGLNIERFAARLMLTLDYVEELAAKDQLHFSFKHLDEIDNDVECLQPAKVIHFQKQPFNVLDKWMIVLFTVVFVFMGYRGFA